MQKFRQLLYPFRLATLQILYQEDGISSIDLRKRLDLSWTDFYNTLHVLKKIKLVSIHDSFDQKGYLRQHLVITEKGRKDYLELINLLDKFVEMAKESIPDIDRDNIFSHYK